MAKASLRQLLYWVTEFVQENPKCTTKDVAIRCGLLAHNTTQTSKTFLAHNLLDVLAANGNIQKAKIEGINYWMPVTGRTGI